MIPALSALSDLCASSFYIVLDACFRDILLKVSDESFSKLDTERWIKYLPVFQIQVLERNSTPKN